MLPSVTDPGLLDRLERYYDTAPRATANAVDVDGFTLFVARTGWRFYGRPVPGRVYDVPDVVQVRRELAERGVPDQLEWVDALVPTLLPAARAAGMTVHEHPLLVLDGELLAADVDGVEVSVLDPDDSRVADVRAAVDAGFSETDDKTPEPVADTIRQRAREGLLVLAGAFEAGGAVGGGTSAPRGDVSELIGIATLPRARRRGIGAAVTAALAADAATRGANTVFLSAGDDAVARVYERVGFARVGIACVAEGPDDSGPPTRRTPGAAAGDHKGRDQLLQIRP